MKRRKRGSSGEPDLPANIPRPVYCPAIDEAPPEERIVLHCVLAPDVAAQKVLLFYRPAGEERFQSVAGNRSAGGWYRLTIPAAAVAGKSLQYYVEARAAGGEVLGNAGRDDSPNLVLVRDGAPELAGGIYAGLGGPRPRRDDDDDEDENEPREEDDPLRALARERAREREVQGLHRRGKGAIFLGVSLGSGYGWHPTGKLEFYDDATIEQGWIPSGLLHLAPELGYQITDDLAVSLLGRMQIISQQGSGDSRPGAPASGAFAALARLQYSLGQGNLRTGLSLYAGAGNFRLTIGPQAGYLRNDSVRGGPLLGGAGLGLGYHFSRHLALVVDGKALYGMPTSAAVIDAAAGLQVGF